jgi:heme/copper-type cytochrome/quinol oxidase subunit 2
MHSYMAGRVIVKTPEEFKAWYETSGTSAKKSS